MKKKEEIICVGTTLYKIVCLFCIGGGYVKRGTLIGFWKQKSHSSLGHFLYAVQAQLKMPQ